MKYNLIEHIENYFFFWIVCIFFKNPFSRIDPKVIKIRQHFPGRVRNASYANTHAVFKGILTRRGKNKLTPIALCSDDKTNDFLDDNEKGFRTRSVDSEGF